MVQTMSSSIRRRTLIVKWENFRNEKKKERRKERKCNVPFFCCWNKLNAGCPGIIGKKWKNGTDLFLCNESSFHLCQKKIKWYRLLYVSWFILYHSVSAEIKISLCVPKMVKMGQFISWFNWWMDNWTMES